MAVTVPIRCQYYNECAGKSAIRCKKCVHNTMRNKEIDYFEEAHDNPIPNPNPRVTYSGPAEQTAGYKCPVCGEHTNPYHLDSENRCSGCGFKLNCG